MIRFMFLKDPSKKGGKKVCVCVCLPIFAKRNTGRKIKDKENGAKVRGLRTGRREGWVWGEISLSTLDSLAF